jgi:iron complex transport system substrate-binding protein
VLEAVQPTPRVISLHAHDFEGMFRDLRMLAKATHTDAQPLEDKLRRRIDVVVRKTQGVIRKRLFCMEWLDPIYCSGHWVPEMVEMAGGRDDLARRKKDSSRIEWESLVAYEPEKLILMPCGFTMDRTRRELHVVTGRPEWKELPAVQTGEVYLADGPSYFNGAGPRLVDGLEILAEIAHPDLFPRRDRRGYVKLGAINGRKKVGRRQRV